MRSYQQYGSIACFTRSIKLSVPEKPNGYSLKKVEEITSKYTSDTVDPNKKRPNVIAVINEAFSDPQVLGDIETNEDYMPFIHDLMKNGNCVSGTTYASIVGGQTANTEYEFLTGNSMAFLPKGTVAFQLYLRHAMPSLVTELRVKDTQEIQQPTFRRRETITETRHIRCLDLISFMIIQI